VAQGTQKLPPDIAKATEAAWQAKSQDSVFIRPAKDLFSQIPSEYIDYHWSSEQLPLSPQS
jgi:mannose-1-phosphate guanylyltransferase